MNKHSNIKIKPGRVWLVGFGPGDPELLTIKGYKLLKACDIIFYDDLTNKEYLNEFDAQKIYVGKRKDKHSIEQDGINKLLLNAAISGKNVVRLKGGDPMLFARGADEVDYLKQHSIGVDIVPGITAALATTALSQIPLTQRGVSSSVTFITGHSLIDINLPKTGTIVVYMGASNLLNIANKAVLEGRDPSTPVLLMYNVSNPDQYEEYTTLQEIVTVPKTYRTPLLVIIGEVVGCKPEITGINSNLYNTVLNCI